MMQITVDPAGLSQAQREAVAGFILAYPQKLAARDTSEDTAVFTRAEISGAAADMLAAFPAPVSAAPDTLTPEMAFGVTAGKFDASGQPHPDGRRGPEGLAPLPAGAAVAHPAPVAQPPAAVTEQPTAPAQAAQATVLPGVALDKTGLPWDARIHAESKAKNADDTWRKKRNLDPTTLAAVEAELRAVMAAPAPAAVHAASAIPSHEAAAPVPAVLQPGPPQPVPFPPVTPVVNAPSPALAPAPAAPDANALQAYIDLVGRASAAVQANKLTQGEITAACAAVGLPALPMLANRLDLLPQVAGSIDAIIATRG